MLDDNTIELEYATLSEAESHSACRFVEVQKLQNDVNYSYFFHEFLQKNVPCVVKIQSLNTWKCAKEWVLNGKPNFTALQGDYGRASVPVADCGTKYYNVQKKTNSLLQDYLKYWRKYIDSDYSSGMPCLYLKDWHFTRDYPNDFIYRVPRYFASDWLNEYLSSRTDIVDDYRFVYMGPKGSWTPLHADVFTSFSWSINITGRKRWLLIPPGQEVCLNDKYGNLAYDATSPDIKNRELFPFYPDLSSLCDIIQESGDAIFVPSGWHHQVWNLEDTISVNHNWVNGCNIATMWKSMQNNLISVKKEIDDCKDMDNWEEHCQIMLKSLFGMNYEDFYKFMLFIATKRIDSLKSCSPLVVYGGWKLGKRHCIYDLKQLRNVLSEFISDPDSKSLKFIEEIDDTPNYLLISINNVLERFIS